MRTSPVHYVDPSAVSIIPNANNSPDDIAVSLTGVKISVYSPMSGINTDENGNFQQWTLQGSNRRLGNSNAPYTIYARLHRRLKTNTDLIFAAKKDRNAGVEGAEPDWCDKYNYVTTDGLTRINGATDDSTYWFVKMGEVSLPENGERTLTFDTGILGTAEFNTEWALNPDSLPLRINISCAIDEEDAGPTPYVYWGQSLVLTAALTEGWTGTDIQRFDHWEIMRDTGNSEADDTWNHPGGAGSYRGLTDGAITLRHERGAAAGATDDFNSSVNTTFTVNAMENLGTAMSPAYSVLKSASICIMAETWEKYELSLAAQMVTYNPITQAYSPSSDISFNIRAIDQKGDVFLLTNKQVSDAGLAAQYAPVGVTPEVWTQIMMTGLAREVAEGKVPIAVFRNQRSINVRLMNAANKELYRTTIAFLRDGEDSKEREWIFLRSTEAITFGTQEHPNPASISGGQVNPSGAATGSDTNKNQDGWVPQGWWDEQQGVDATNRYEYGAYRDFVKESGGVAAHWGDFTTPKIWNHYGKDGEPSVVYNLLPSVNQIGVVCSESGTYTPSVYPIVCGYTKSVGGEITEVADAVRPIDHTTGSTGYLIVFRRRLRASGDYESRYYVYNEAGRNLLSTFNVATYDQIEFRIIPYNTLYVTEYNPDPDEPRICYYSSSNIYIESYIDSKTVLVVPYGQSAPYYTKEWYAWSSVAQTASITTSPFEEPYSGWSEGAIPDNTGGLAYLWRKSVKYTYNAQSNSYVAGTAQYVRLSGTNGTSIDVNGTVEYVVAAGGSLPTTDVSYGDLGIIINEARIYIYKTRGWAIHLANITDGSSYTVAKDNTIGGVNLKGHLLMWSDEAHTADSNKGWIDLGIFQGSNGVTYYTHIAWATIVNTAIPWSGTIPAGQISTPNYGQDAVTGGSTTPASDGSKPWMGVLINTDSDPDTTNWHYYTWTNTKGAKGDDGEDGDDAVNVIVSPASMIVEQDINNKDNIKHAADNNLGRFSIQVLKGSTACAITSITASASRVYISHSASTGDFTGDECHTWQPDVPTIADLFLKGIGQDNEDNYYTTGEITLTITYTDPDTHTGITVTAIIIKVFVNLIGSWSETVVGDAKYEVAKSLSYAYDPTGENVIELENFGQYIKSSTENVSILTKKVGDGKNIFSGVLTGDGWKSAYTVYDTLHDVTIDDDGYMNRASGDTYIISPPFYIQSGITYKFSFKGVGTSNISVAVFKDDLSQNVAVWNAEYNSELQRHVAGLVNTYTGSVRFLVSTTKIIYPQAETGNEATAFDSGSVEMSSRIKQTAEEIDLSVRHDLEETGINISNRLITAKTNNFSIRNNVTEADGLYYKTDNRQEIGEDTRQPYGSEKTFGIDPFGGMTSPDGAPIQGAMWRRKTAMVQVNNQYSPFVYAGWFKSIYNQDGEESYELRTIRTMYDMIVLYCQDVQLSDIEVWLPPAKLIEGQELTIVNATYKDRTGEDLYPTTTLRLVACGQCGDWGDGNIMTPEWTWGNIGYGFLWLKKIGQDFSRTYNQLDITKYSMVTLRAVAPGNDGQAIGSDELTGEWVVVNAVKREEEQQE